MQVQVGGRAIPVACASWSFAALPLARAARVARALGFDRVDIGFAHLPPDLSPAPLRRGRALKRELRAAGVTASDLFPVLPFETNDPDGGRRRRNRSVFESIVGLAQGVGSPGITLKPGIRQPSQPDEGWRICLDVLGDYCSLARRSGLRFSVEPHVDSILEEPSRARKLAEDLGGLRLITLDYSHFVAQGFEPEALRALHPYAAHLHFRQAARGRVQSPAKAGTIPMGRVLEELVACGYTGALSMEYQHSDWQGCNDIDVVTETVLSLRELGVRF